jgi:hypothetical protein
LANEVTGSFSIGYDDGVQERVLAVSSRIFTSTGKRVSTLVQSVGTSEEAAALGDIANVGAFAIVNLDDTNYVNVKVATGGAIFARLDPDVDADGKGGFVCGSRLGSGAQVPFLIADTAACKVAILWVEV